MSDFKDRTGEQEKWEDMSPSDWSDSINGPDSTFTKLYKITQSVIEDVTSKHSFDVIFEIGCGTGEVINSLNTNVPRIGIDFNPQFIESCRAKYEGILFEVVDATELMVWWAGRPESELYKSPLVLCCNNTLNIMPASVRYQIVSEMRKLCGDNGRIIVSYWNGDFFSHGVADFYSKNPELCGKVDMEVDVNWEEHTLVSSTGYHTEWLSPARVHRMMKSYDIDIKRTKALEPGNCVFANDLGIFAVFGNATSSGMRDLYDSAEASDFFLHLYGEESVGEATTFMRTMQADIEQDMVRFIGTKVQQYKPHLKEKPIPCRVLEVGCGSGGLMRQLAHAGVLKHGVGIDMSFSMCENNRAQNDKAGLGGSITVVNESFFDMSALNESKDLVVGLVALCSASTRYRDVLKEMYRVLRPGGWIILTDMTSRCATADPQLLDALHIPGKLPTISDIKEYVEDLGFRDFSYHSFGGSLMEYYSGIRAAFAEWKGTAAGAASSSSTSKMEHDFATLQDLSDSQLDWGRISFQKVF